MFYNGILMGFYWASIVFFSRANRYVVIIIQNSYSNDAYSANGM